MGHKINPLIFRSKIFPIYSNLWDYCTYNYNNIINFSFFYYLIEKNKKQNNVVFFKLDSWNKYYSWIIFIYSKNKFINNRNKIQENILNFYKKKYSDRKITYISFKFIKYPFLSNYFILNYILKKLSSKYIILRKIIPQLALIFISLFNIKGFKCIVSGRINGAQMAKTETFNFKKNSLTYKFSLIKYSFGCIKTKYGILGVKLWLFLK